MLFHLTSGLSFADHLYGSCWDSFKDECTLIFAYTSLAFSAPLPHSFRFSFWYITCLDWSLNHYNFLVFVCTKFLPKNRNFITLLSVLQLKSASNSLLIFAGSYQDKRACCPIPCTTHSQTTTFIVATISLLSLLSKIL
jgi:hypothetical protein